MRGKPPSDHGTARSSRCDGMTELIGCSVADAGLDSDCPLHCLPVANCQASNLFTGSVALVAPTSALRSLQAKRFRVLRLRYSAMSDFAVLSHVPVDTDLQSLVPVSTLVGTLCPRFHCAFCPWDLHFEVEISAGPSPSPSFCSRTLLLLLQYLRRTTRFLLLISSLAIINIHTLTLHPPPARRTRSKSWTHDTHPQQH